MVVGKVPTTLKEVVLRAISGNVSGTFVGTGLPIKGEKKRKLPLAQLGGKVQYEPTIIMFVPMRAVKRILNSNQNTHHYLLK